MTNWKEYKLGELCTITSSKRIFYKEYVSEGVPFFRSKEIIEKANGNDISTELFITKDKFQEIKDKFGVPLAGDILLTSVGTLGVSYQVQESDYFYFKDGNLTWFKDFSDKINTKFLLYWLRSPLGKEGFNNITIGSTQAALTIAGLKGIKLSIPDLPTQTAIAEILSSLDDKIELNNKINQELENLAQTLFKQWFIDFEFPNENGEPYKSSGGEMVDSELGEIPKGWCVDSIYKISDVIYGAPFKSNLFNQENKGFPLIRIRDLKTFKPQNWTEEVHPKGTKIFAGDLVVGMDAEFRPHFWLGNPAWLNQRVCHFRPKRNFSKLFVREIIRPQLAFFENSSVGTTVIHLGKADIDTFKSIIPTNEVLIRFEEISNSILEDIINNSKETQELTNLRDILLPKLISGELEVSDALTQTIA